MIDEQTAVAIARAEAQSMGWAFGEPVEAVLRQRRSWFGKLENRGRWSIRTNAMARGTCAWFVIDAVDGRVLEKGYVPR